MKIHEITGYHGSPNRHLPQSSDVLYHGTSIDNLVHIAATNKFLTDLDADKWHRGVSLTRSLAVAWQHAHSRQFNGTNVFPKNGAVIVFSRTKLIAQCGVLIPVDDLGNDEEQEERTSGMISPAFQSIVSVQIHAPDLVAFRSIMRGNSGEFSSEHQQAWQRLQSRIKAV